MKFHLENHFESMEFDRNFTVIPFLRRDMILDRFLFIKGQVKIFSNFIPFV